MTELPITMPSIIFVQGIPYRIVRLDPKEQSEPLSLTLENTEVSEDSINNDTYLGTIDHDHQKIEINPDYPDYSLKITLLHEVLHGCLNLIDQDDESLVHMLSYVLLNTMRSNPGFVQYLMEGIL